ncbi:MutS family DNA mismatch repair protein [Bdellovibrio sp. HCB209]|uniref:MutS family DNA mismatch repair protein n=1 Tax=Bdellovibrio sp. HCB209 TaxID=3394354 RepID=UPI0039B4E1B4
MIDSLKKKEKRLHGLVEKWTLKLQKHQSARLTTGLIIFLSFIPITMMEKAQWVFTIPGVLILIFVVLVIRTRKIQRHALHLERHLQFTRRQLNRCLGKESQRSWKPAYELRDQYPLISDIGLMGSHSLWTLLDETLSEGGMRKLLGWMSTTPKAETIKSRQKTIQNLRSESWFYTRLSITANSNDMNLSTSQIQNFLKNSFVNPSFMKLLFLNLGLWILTAAAFIFSAQTEYQFPRVVFWIFPVLSMVSISSVKHVFSEGTGLAVHLEVLAPIFAAIEKRTQTNKAMANLCPTVKAHSPSKAARKLEIILSFLGTQTNPLLHFLLNAFLPWTMVSVFFLEVLRKKITKDFPECLNELSELEVIGSLLIFDKYQTQTYAEFKNQISLSCEQVFHPLLDRSKVVANDFSFSQGQSLGLLTGSNMSGKSTFLRTIGINQVLANMGAPVFAKSFSTYPMKVETCIEVSDSLRDGYSYFYAEVRRLKDILQSAASKQPILYLIDEIFRGTNNRERQIGSRAVIKTLAQESTALGFISTHDLELTVLEQSNPSLINLHFREDINESGQMVFSYHLNHGPCPTTNALKIMAAEGIKVEDI